MIECTIIRRTKLRSCSLNGHAGYSDNGDDIVCAAVSVLCAALDASCMSHSSYNSSGTMGSGDFHAAYTGYSDAVNGRFDMFETGLRLIERQYPQCIHIKTIKREDEQEKI